MVKWEIQGKILFQNDFCSFHKKERITRPAWAGFKTAEEGIAIIMSYIL